MRKELRYPPGKADDNGLPWDDLIPALLEAAAKESLLLTFHLEPYKERTIENLRRDIAYIVDTYSSHPAFYKYQHMGESRPFFYVYDSYHISTNEWRTLLAKGDNSIRGTKYDAFFMGLLVKESDRTEMVKAHFDGFYTYFASDGFSYGSTSANWASLSAFARKNKLIFSASVGPGYMDERVRPWNKAATRARHGGAYYTAAWSAAISARSPLVSLTSFNEWHEGTQLEPAVPHDTNLNSYLTYGDSANASSLYLDLTRKAVQDFTGQDEADLKPGGAELAAAAALP